MKGIAGFPKWSIKEDNQSSVEKDSAFRNNIKLVVYKNIGRGWSDHVLQSFCQIECKDFYFFLI